jgi:DNA recombination protein RmuC
MINTKRGYYFMEIFIFILGFIFGAIAVFIPFFIASKKDNTAIVAEQMKLEFENLANKIFKESSQDITEQNKEKLEEFFKRFRDRIEDFEKKNTENFEIEKKNLTVFDENIKQFISAGKEISTQTSTLVNTMKSDNRRQGNWGEIVLEKVLESSGLRKDAEYSVQLGTAEGRPDATVFLPEGKQVYIDAKTSLASWSGYVNSAMMKTKKKFT